MELHELGTTKLYINGGLNNTKTHNITTDDNYETLGFNNGIVVIRIMGNNSNNSTITDKAPIDDKSIKIECNRSSSGSSNESTVVVRVDPVNGKKYVYKNGKRCGELVALPPTQQQSSRLINVKLNASTLKVIKLKQSPMLKTIPTLKIDDKMKAVYNYKRTQSTITENLQKSDKYQQTDDQTVDVERCEIGVQTMNNDQIDDYISRVINNDQFLNMDLLFNGNLDAKPIVRNLIDPNKPKSHEEFIKLNFFNDMNRALTFDRSGNLPIHESVMQNNVKLVRQNCVILHARKESINIYNAQNYTPLHLAILHNVSNDVLSILLKSGADISLTDADGNTAIHLAVDNNRIGLLKILLDHAIRARFNLNTYNYDGFTPLILSCCTRSYEITKLLLDKGVDPNVRDMKSGRTALFHAAETYDVGIVQLLINNKADTKVRNFVGTSPHDAMFELEDVPLKIKCLILGKEQIRLQTKRKLEQQQKLNKQQTTTSDGGGGGGRQIKKTKMEVTSILQKVEPKFQAVLDRVQFKNKC